MHQKPISKIKLHFKKMSAMMDFLVSIQINGEHSCGGFILSDAWLATAAHCLAESIPPSNVTIRAGDKSISNLVAKYEHFAAEIIHHPNFTAESRDNDIALVKLDVTEDRNPFNLNVTTIKAIPLLEEGMETKVGAWVQIAGWGHSVNLLRPSLQCATLSVISPAQCDQRLARFGGITDNMLCAEDPSFSGRDACQNDAGGALVHNGEAVGVISWGIGCANEQYPGVYTKISSPSVRGFIRTHVGV